MIEKNSEVISLLSLSAGSENKLEDNSFLDYIDKKKKDKKNGHGEDINIRMFNIFPELYSKHIASDEKNSPSVTKKNRTGIQSTALYEMLENRQKRHATLLPASKINENDVSPRDGISLSSSRLASTEATVVNISGKLTRTGEDDVREQNTETPKIHTLSGQLKNDGMPFRQELARQDMQPRRPQSSVTEHMLPADVGAISKSAATKKQSINLKYPFLRWAGEHSVKVSIPMDLSRSRHLSLFPSDSRAAETLSRQVSHLNGFTTELLHPQHNDEESERRHNQHSQEEEQE